MTTSSHKSPMTSQVRSLLQSSNIPSSAYVSILSEFDAAVTYINDLLILLVMRLGSQIFNS